MPKQVRWDSTVFPPRPKMPVPSPVEPTPAQPEFQVQEGRIWLGRWEGDRLVAEACRLRRISQNGALVLLESHLPEGKAVWATLRGRGNQVGSVPARVAKSALVAPGAVLAWLQFGIPCPAELLYAAVFGPDALEASLN